MFEVITVGSASVDVFVDTSKKELRKHHGHEDVCYIVGSKHLVKDINLSTGGGGTNSATAFSRMGLKTGWIGAIGDDEHSIQIKNMLKQEKISFLGKVKKGKSGYSVILIDLHHDRTILTYKGVNNRLGPEDIMLSSLRPKWFYLSAMMGRSFETSKKIAVYAKKKKIPYAFNPSCYLAKKGLRQLGPLVNGCSLLILNLEEAQALLGSSIKNPIVLAKRLAKHALCVVVTQGSKGATACDGSHTYVLKAKKCPVIDTTGAGDSFAAATVAGIIRGLSFEDSLRLGYAQSTCVIGSIGAKKGLVSMNKARSLVKKQKIKVDKISIK